MELRRKAHKSDSHKKSIYLSPDMQDEVKVEAERLDRSVSWVVQRCIRHGLKELRKLPTEEKHG